ncbi:MAG: FixH family protein [Planctomycetota bacterium]
MSEHETKSAALWPWLWLILVLIACIPNGIMIYTASTLGADSVSAHPYQDSKDYDRQKRLRNAFASLGFRLETVCAGDGSVQLQLLGPETPQAVTLLFRRPADASLDRRLDWADPSQAIAVELPAPGLWQLELHADTSSGPIATRSTLPGV